MIQKLTKHNSDLALVFDQALLVQLQIDEKTRLELTTEDGKLVITPVDEDECRAKLEEVLEQVNKQYGNALKRLADS